LACAVCGRDDRATQPPASVLVAVRVRQLERWIADLEETVEDMRRELRELEALGGSGASG
jgi:hypothetical protein